MWKPLAWSIIPENFSFLALTVHILLRLKYLYWVCMTTAWRATLRDGDAGSLFLRESYTPPLIAICSSNDSSWQALKVCQRNPHPETYYYVVIAPPQGVHKFINFIVRRNGCYRNSFQAISRRWYFGSQPWVTYLPPIWYSVEPSLRALQLCQYDWFRKKPA